jgi:chorismate mutase
MVRGIRGAITVEQNTAEEILQATAQLLKDMVELNQLPLEEIASVLFSTSPDLNAAFPAAAAREMGWIQVPMMCTQEIAVPGGLAKCIRVLITVNIDKTQQEIQHVYLRGAKVLRPDLA